MSPQRIIAVAGATGAQGGGLVRAVLADRDGPFTVRALTRNADSDKARALADAGAEVVACDIDDPASLDRAYAGCYGAFCVTFFWDHLSPERELAEARNMAEAAKRAGLQHVIWSTLEDTRRFVPLESDQMPTLHGKYKVPHFDAKGEADDLFRTANVPTTFLLTTFYWDNFVYFGSGPRPGPDGTLQLTLPIGDETLAGIAAEDIGKCSYGIFKRGQELIGQTVGIAGEHLTGEEMAAKMSKALGRPVRYNSIPPEVFRAFDIPAADDLGNMFQFYRDFGEYFRKSRDVEFARRLNPELQTFDDWLARHKDQIPLD